MSIRIVTNIRAPLRGGYNVTVITAILLSMTIAAGSLSAKPKSAKAPSQSKPATTQPVTELKANVIEASGSVDRAPVGAGVLDADAWVPVKVGDELASGTQIRTALRSYVVLLFGDDTVVSVRRATLASIDQFYKTETTKTVHLGLGYGAVRGGTTEGILRSDVVVDSPVATLAKRGTEGWEMEVEPYTGRWRISLARSGLIEALQKLTGQRRLVRAGQYANQLNIAKAWIHQATFDRTIRFVSAQSVTRADLDFNTRVTGGIAPVAVGGGAQLRTFAGRGGPPPVFRPDLTRTIDQFNRLRDLLDTLLVVPPVVSRPEGNFGVPSVNLLIDRREVAKLRRLHRFR